MKIYGCLKSDFDIYDFDKETGEKRVRCMCGCGKINMFPVDFVLTEPSHCSSDCILQILREVVL